MARRIFSYNSNPYPNGSLHLGHARIYVLSDINVRYQRALGNEVLFCVGFDAFGLPTETAAAAQKTSAAELTNRSIEIMQRQFGELEVDFSRTHSTADPVHVQRTQAIFAELFRAGLAFREARPVNWCPSCEVVLAEVQVVDGVCWRCGGPVNRRLQMHWLLGMKQLAAELEAELERAAWPEWIASKISHMIGRRAGWDVELELVGGGGLVAFSPEKDFLDQAELAIVASHHPIAQRIREEGPLDAVHPTGHGRIPVLVSDDYEHYDDSVASLLAPARVRGDRAFVESLADGEGRLRRSEPSTAGAAAPAPEPPPVALPVKPSVRYRLRDWLVSRQRYWGVPIPIVHCPACGEVALPESALPVLPPDREVFVQGLDPRRDATGYYRLPCPDCGGPARLETDTLDGLVCTFWGQYRPLLPDAVGPGADRGTPIPWFDHVFYQCGSDCVRYLLTFLYGGVVFRRLGLAWNKEPFHEIFANGMVLRDNRKMSKSSGNSVSPEEVMREHGAATLRFYVASMGVPAKDVNWDWPALKRCASFLRRFEQALRAETIGAAEGRVAPLRRRVKARLESQVEAVRRAYEERTYNRVALGLMELGEGLLAEIERFGSRGEAPGADPALRELLRESVRLLQPLCPGLAKRIWSAAGFQGEGELDALRPPTNRETCRWLVERGGRYVGHFFDRPDLEPADALETARSHRKLAGLLAGEASIGLRVSRRDGSMVLELASPDAPAAADPPPS